MNDNEFKGAGLRRAALTLHALGESDRAWLLERLPLARRHALQELLAELQTLGLPPDADIVRSALAATPVPQPSGAAEALALCRSLEREAPVLQSLFLAALSEAERSSVLGHWQSEFQAPPAAVAPPAWTEAVRQAVQSSWRAVATDRKNTP